MCVSQSETRDVVSQRDFFIVILRRDEQVVSESDKKTKQNTNQSNHSSDDSKGVEQEKSKQTKIGNPASRGSLISVGAQSQQDELRLHFLR